ncbi:MAG TPA: formylglycine-generating enzyme family protein [Phycisphaerae bacterium]|nr:formylglycine-generating enzyme family protein [Phycisphaerae bacterium]HRW52445.1 formylglycine-generating enzyme family protein [Phycisphaerae bacterium]
MVDQVSQSSFIAGIAIVAISLASPSSARCDTPDRPGPATTTAPAAIDDGAPPGMVWIPGGDFSMGSVDPLARRDESPVHRVRVEGFWIDATEVTNARYAAFVKATGYRTIAERPIDWNELKKQLPDGTPRPDDATLRPGSLVFRPPSHPVDLRNPAGWWEWTIGANWRHPAGPKSDIKGMDDYPVVQIAFEDAVAYADWAGKSLPTEAQWEFAARGGLDGKVNDWGDAPIDATRCNTWQGRFPYENTAKDGYIGAAPVKQFPPNGYGLYDMAGNVWEWCADLYREDTYAMRVANLTGADGVKVAVNPMGPDKSFDPRNPHAPEVRVQRGGSFLCNDSYCASYRPSARMASSPDSGLQHLGFRCVMTREAWLKRRPRPKPRDH